MLTARIKNRILYPVSSIMRVPFIAFYQASCGCETEQKANENARHFTSSSQLTFPCKRALFDRPRKIRELIKNTQHWLFSPQTFFLILITGLRSTEELSIVRELLRANWLSHRLYFFFSIMKLPSNGEFRMIRGFLFPPRNPEIRQAI